MLLQMLAMLDVTFVLHLVATVLHVQASLQALHKPTMGLVTLLRNELLAAVVVHKHSQRLQAHCHKKKMTMSLLTQLSKIRRTESVRMTPTGRMQMGMVVTCIANTSKLERSHVRMRATTRVEKQRELAVSHARLARKKPLTPQRVRIRAASPNGKRKQANAFVVALGLRDAMSHMSWRIAL